MESVTSTPVPIESKTWLTKIIIKKRLSHVNEYSNENTFLSLAVSDMENTYFRSVWFLKQDLLTVNCHV
jgi:hypothetical protein